MKIPDNYQTVMPYLIIEGAEKFIEFTQTVFNAIVTENHARSEGIIMHAEIMIGGSTIMFADVTEHFARRPAGMFVYVENADETYAKALANGAESIMPPADQPYGRSCGIKDPFGNSWWPTTPHA
jgi:PhnB protein